jgi:SM-20-related protein
MPARVAEVAPDEGNIFAFVRSDHSWHGHTPFVGERQVVQVTWLRDASELERKKRRGRLAWLLKGTFRR